MSSETAFTHSPEYLARQEARRTAIKVQRERLTWTDAQFLAERDAAYVAEQRGYVQPRIDNLLRDMDNDNDIEGYVRKYGTDEG